MDGELREPYLSQVKEHLDYCQACRERLEDFRSLSEDIRAMKLSDSILSRNKDKIFSHLEEKYFLSVKSIQRIVTEEKRKITEETDTA